MYSGHGVLGIWSTRYHWRYSSFLQCYFSSSFVFWVFKCTSCLITLLAQFPFPWEREVLVVWFSRRVFILLIAFHTFHDYRQCHANEATSVVMECLEYDWQISLMRQGFSTSTLDIGVRRSEVVHMMRYVGAPLELNIPESWGTVVRNTGCTVATGRHPFVGLRSCVFGLSVQNFFSIWAKVWWGYWGCIDRKILMKDPKFLSLKPSIPRNDKESFQESC
jgi:hypothetical protein